MQLKSTGEIFELHRGSSSVHNLVFGQAFIWHEGDYSIKNLTSGEEAIVTLPK